MKNIVLIGLPGCGKTTVSKELASKLARPWYDSDLLIEKEEAMPISQIFEQKGEGHFRKKETACLQRLCQMQGAVFSVGGGAVLYNAALLKQNTVVIYLRRSVEGILSTLEEGTRPLLKDKSRLQILYDERRALYEGLCDHIVENETDVNTAVYAILEVLK